MRVVPLLAHLALCSIALAQPQTKPTLLDLAKKKFAPRALTDAETKLFTNTEQGKPAVELTGDDKQDDPANAATWPDARVVHGECLAWLCTDSEALKRVTYRGIQINGMRIDGKLDLEFAQIPFPLRTWKCAFTDEIILRQAHLSALYLQFTDVKDVAAAGVKIEGYLFLRDHFKSEGELEFAGATIGKDLDCNGAQLTNPHGKALNADGAKIDGGVFLGNGFKAQGEVNLLGAAIGGGLNCDGAQLINPKGYALNANRARIAESAFVNNGFNSKGEVNFVGATIGGNLVCIDAHFLNTAGRALNAEGAQIARTVFLRGGFTADGVVDFINANIVGDLEWHEIKSQTNAILDLRGAKVGTLCDKGDSWPTNGKLFLDGFIYNRIDDQSPVHAKDRVNWLHRQPRDKFRPQPYEHLASVLRNMGHEREARLVMIEKNQDHANFTTRFSQEWWWYNVFGWLIGYGYAPSRAFLISLGMIALGWLLFHLCYVRNIISPTDERGYVKDAAGQIVLENGRHRFSEEYPKFNAFVYSLESFTPLLKLDQSASWTPNANRGVSIHFCRLHFTTGSLARAYLWFHIMAGWVLTSLWVGGITGLVKS